PIMNKYYISRVPCRCDCNRETMVSCRQLLNNQTKSCGCLRSDIPMARTRKSKQEGRLVPIDAGSRFGKLVVVSDEPVGRGPKRKMQCLCDCGNECLINVASLRGSTKSCGCLKRVSQDKVHPVPVGERFGNLVVLRRAEGTGRGRIVEAQCDCGKLTIANVNNMRNGHTKSCGCLKAAGSERSVKHGHARTGKFKNPTYSVYRDMLTRCGNSNYKEFHLYGGRGITVCERWKQGYEFFLADMGERPPGLTLERERVNEGYSPSNCKWATDEEQANNKRNNVVIELGGKRLTIAQWSRELNIKAGTLYFRASKGWPPERILSV
ncbi:MAG: hypothetical protein JWN43_113, partial [Gammaproteobacteria bacterium]|nr:hypothetical protein [Gammaproteobacteria bacterium]